MTTSKKKIIEKEINRYKKLPSDDEMALIRKILDHCNHKLVYIHECFWFNAITRRKGIVRDIPLYAPSDNGDRPIAITSIIVYKDGDMIGEFVFNMDYSHINISRDTWSIDVTTRLGESTENPKYTLYIRGHAVCSPITRSHLFRRSEHDLELIFKGQISGQNNNSAFRQVLSVENSYMDQAIKVEGSGTFLKRTAPLAQLITRKSLNYLQQPGALTREITSKRLPANDSEILIKRTTEPYYTCIKKDDLYKYEETLSYYYPIIEYNTIQAITNNLPKQEVDVACFGLGSAGTAILDQTTRSNFVNAYYLCDFDTIEAKNLRNQWYTKAQVGRTKVEASKQLICNRQGTTAAISECPTIFGSNNKLEGLSDLNCFKFKYTLSAFDSIDVRLTLFDYIKTGKIETEYLIDTRYDQFSSSIFFIDTKDEKQMKYYEDNLLETKRLIDEVEDKTAVTKEEYMKWVEDRDVASSHCNSTRAILRIPAGPCPNGCRCGDDECRAHWESFYDKYPHLIKHNEYIKPQSASSCILYNFIDIYKYTGAFVFATMRAINNDEKKVFTHIEATTDPIPQHMIVRK